MFFDIEIFARFKDIGESGGKWFPYIYIYMQIKHSTAFEQWQSEESMSNN